MVLIRVFAITAGVSGLVACGDDEGSSVPSKTFTDLSPVAACDTRSTNQACSEYIGSGYTLTLIEQTCDGTVVDRCEHEGAIGRCVKPESSTQFATYQYSTNIPESEWRDSCEASGDTWE